MPTFYAILHIPSGGYLPQRTRNTSNKRFSRHYTGGKPTTIDPPRLFRRRQDAQAALNYWLEGEWGIYRSGGYDTTEEWGLDAKYKPERKKEEMKVVEVIVTQYKD